MRLRDFLVLRASDEFLQQPLMIKGSSDAQDQTRDSTVESETPCIITSGKECKRSAPFSPADRQGYGARVCDDGAAVTAALPSAYFNMDIADQAPLCAPVLLH